MGHAEDDPATEDSRRKFEHVAAQLARGDLPAWRKRWLEIDLERHWNFEAPYRPMIGTGSGEAVDAPGSDTVGLVVCDGATLAVALSTGGASPMLAGRVGDTPLPGAGFWCSPAAAVTATGVGEEIARKLLCKWVHDRIAGGEDPQAACEAGVALYPPEIPIGLLAVTPSGWGVQANKVMAWAAWDGAQALDAVGDSSRTTDEPDD